MAKLDDLIQQKQQRDEDWKAKKTAEREELGQLSDDAVMHVTSEPGAYLHYLDIVDRTNALRRENGVAALRVNDRLMQAAQVRADEMAAHTVYSHTRPNGGKFNTVADCPYMAENIHRIADWTMSNQTLAERAATDWYASTVHHKNMVNPKLSEIGVGLARGINDTGDPCWYCVQLFLYDGCSVTRVDTPTNK